MHLEYPVCILIRNQALELVVVVLYYYGKHNNNLHDSCASQTLSVK